jgi:hypothetical protein
MKRSGDYSKIFCRSNKGQVTIFIIVAIVLVLGVALYFIFNNEINNNVPEELTPVYSNFIDCVNNELSLGIDLVETQGGYVYLPDFEPGSRYSPFSNQLDFLGNPIPYWYYVSGNGIEKENIPSINFMESELEEFIESRVRSCDFDVFYDDGFVVDLGVPNADVSIADKKVVLNLEMDVGIEGLDRNVLVKKHKVEVISPLRELYFDARDVYEKQQNDLFLENYTIDVLRLYAPVDGVEIQCSPKIWEADDVFNNLEEGLEANIMMLKSEEGNYDLSPDKKNEYFVVEGLKGDVRFLTSKNWPHVIQVNPSNGAILKSDPVGNQEGLGIMGFCYVPYHYVYDVKYPVLIQVYNGNEFFQFPMAVVIESNNPRKPLEGAFALDYGLPELCEYKNTQYDVNIYDSNLRKVDANLSFSCFGTFCDIGSSMGGEYEGLFPQCVNGKIIAEAEGYEKGEYQIDSLNDGFADIILTRLYNLDVDLNMDGRSYDGEVIITFSKEDGGSEVVVYPDKKNVELSEGQYEIMASVYRESNIDFGVSSYEECVDVPSGGLGGLFGFTKEECFDIEIPSESFGNVPVGGGKQNYYISESELTNSNSIVINVKSLPTPNNLEDLQNNYILVEENGLGVYFK